MTRRARTEVAGAASTSVREVLTGPDQEGHVLGVFPRAAYVQVPRTVVALLAPEATRLPNGVVLADAEALALLVVGDPATVGTGRVTAGPLAVTVVRWWSVRPRRPVADPAGLAARARRLATLSGEPPVRAELVRACATVDADALRAATYALLGLGPGLTPSGDDVVAGLMVGLRRLGLGGLADQVGPAVTTAARRRTTALSAALLELAARGEAAATALDLVDALAGHGDLEQAAQALFALGHTSGRDLAAGLAIAAATVAESLPAPRGIDATIDQTDPSGRPDTARRPATSRKERQ